MRVIKHTGTWSASHEPPNPTPSGSVLVLSLHVTLQSLELMGGNTRWSLPCGPRTVPLRWESRAQRIPACCPLGESLTTKKTNPRNRGQLYH